MQNTSELVQKGKFSVTLLLYSTNNTSETNLWFNLFTGKGQTKKIAVGEIIVWVKLYQK
jgi:hypothetical protein